MKDPKSIEFMNDTLSLKQWGTVGKGKAPYLSLSFEYGNIWILNRLRAVSYFFFWDTVEYEQEKRGHAPEASGGAQASSLLFFFLLLFRQ